MKGVYIVLLGLAVWMAGCSDRGRLAGSGSVTTNGFTGTVTRDGAPAAGVRVALFPEAYNPLRESALPEPRKDTTDGSGRFRFDDVVAGAYNIIASNPDGATSALMVGLDLSEDDSLHKLPTVNLEPVGAIEVRIPEFAREVSGAFYLPGTDIHATLDSAAIAKGSIQLSLVPAATYASLIYLPPGADSGRNILAGPLLVAPGGSGTVNPYALWKRAYKATLNTSASGADMADDLAGFPLLVRLDSGNFDFGAALPDGADLRITKSDSITALPFEIESWDPMARTAEVWVRVDTLRGNQAIQFLCLYAGREGAAPVSNGAAVFDRASGYKGVWHLGESPVGDRGMIRDRTANAYHGTSGGAMTEASLTRGIVGKALVLDGKNDFIELPASNLFVPRAGQSLTLSAWIRPDSLAAIGDSIRHRLISFKTDSAGLSSLAWGIGSTGTMAHYNRDKEAVLNWATQLAAATVYHVALTFEAGRFAGYVNGKLDFSASGLVLVEGGSQPVMLGTHIPGNRQFQGLVDEVRVEAAPRSGSWIRLSYESQRPGAAVVRLDSIR